MATLTELQAFASQTNYDIPMIDYQVGVPASITRFTNYHTLPASGAAITYSASNNTVYIHGNNVVVSGYDFSGTTVVVNGNNVTIKNSKFDASYGYYALTQSTGFSGLVVDHNTFDGLKLDKNYARFINSGDSKITITYNQFLNAPSDAVALTNGIVDHNYFSGAGYETGAHADAIWVPNTTGPVLITNNFVDSRKTADAIVTPNNAVQINNRFGATSNVTVTGNVLLGGSYTVDVEDRNGLPISGISITNNYVANGLYGNLYPVNQPANLVYAQNSATTVTSSIGPTVVPYAGQTIKGTAGSVGEVLQGTGGSDHIFGHGNNDKLVGGGGRDYLFGATGADVFVYKAGSDSIGNQTDIISSFEDGVDKIDVSALGADASGKITPQTFIGTAAFSGKAGQVRDVQSGSSTWVEVDVDGDKVADLRVELQGAHTLNSGSFILAPAPPPPPVIQAAPLATAAIARSVATPQPTVATDSAGNLLVTATKGVSGQVLTGGAGSDHLFANGQHDQLIGGAGRDYLFGAAGADTFVYKSASDSTATAGDVIANFEDAFDTLDLHAIVGTGAPLSYIGSQAFNGIPGALHTVQAGASTFIEADLNGDKRADFRIELQGVHSLSSSNFLL